MGGGQAVPMMYSTFLLSRAALTSTSPPTVTQVTAGLTHLGGFKMRVVLACPNTLLDWVPPLSCPLLLLMHIVSCALKAKQAQQPPSNEQYRDFAPWYFRETRKPPSSGLSGQGSCYVCCPYSLSIPFSTYGLHSASKISD